MTHKLTIFFSPIKKMRFFVLLSLSLCDAWVVQSPARPSVVSIRRVAASQIQAQAQDDGPEEPQPTGMTPERRRFEVDQKGFLCESDGYSNPARPLQYYATLPTLPTAPPLAPPPAPPPTRPSRSLRPDSLRSSCSLPSCDSKDGRARGHAGLLLKVRATLPATRLLLTRSTSVLTPRACATRRENFDGSTEIGLVPKITFGVFGVLFLGLLVTLITA